MITMEIKGDEALKKWLSLISEKYLKDAERTATRVLIHIRDKIVEKLSGKVLGIKTGTLRESIQVIPAKKTSTGWDGMVFTKTKYAEIHETGGIIRAKAHPYLTIYLYKLGIVRRVRQVTIPARPYFYPTLDEEKGWIDNTFRGLLASLK